MLFRSHAVAELGGDESEYQKLNVDSTQMLLEAGQKAGTRAFVLFSSIKAMGEGGDEQLDETCPLPPDTPYGRTKKAAEALVLSGEHLPHGVALRLSMVYGVTEKGNLPRMIRMIEKGLFPPLPEVGNRRSMIHRDDVVEAALLAAENPNAAGEVFILTGPEAASTRQLHDWIREALGLSPRNWSVPLWLLKLMALTGDLIGGLRGRRFLFDPDALLKLTGSAWYDASKIERRLGFRPRHGLRESLPEIVKGLKDV